MRTFESARPVFWVAVLILLISSVGCAQLEYAPKGNYIFYHKQLPAADRAIETARSAGKDRECPDAFREAEKLKNDAYETYWACHTQEAIRMANEAVAKANALCPRVAPAAVAPPPAPPTVSLSANPAAIVAGQCSTLNWTSTNANTATINQGIGGVAPSGSRQVCPTITTQYEINASGPGGSRTASTTVAVNAPPAPPTVSLSANPAAIVAGQCSTLNWTSTNANTATINQGIGGVTPSGSRQACPTTTTQYEINATGPGGSRTASTTVTVNPPPPKPAERLVLHINFDTDKAVIRPADRAELQKAIDFVKQHPGQKISIEGHTDSTGTAKYNQGLSERRAAAVKDYLLKNGVTDGGRIATSGYGQTKPVASNSTKQGRFENRRVEIVVQP
ncbi:MAG TPA: OmpA family protein [Candidatus Methylomirabilis sp.]|nr:OmpA family protein [Candidatus Methylomirabilis sp.]